MLELAERAVVVVEADAAADLDADVRGRDVLRERIRRRRHPLPAGDVRHRGTKVHAPDRLGTEFPDVEPKRRRVEIGSEPRQEVREVCAVVLAVRVLEHVVLALMPEETFERRIESLFFKVGHRGSDGLEQQRIHLEARGVLRIPVAAEMGSARRDLHDRDVALRTFGHIAGEDELRSHHAANRLQRHPALRVGLVLAADHVPEADVVSRRGHAPERREPIHVGHLRIGALHVRLAREDEDPDVLARVGHRSHEHREGEDAEVMWSSHEMSVTIASESSEASIGRDG